MILMLQSLDKVTFLVGSKDRLSEMIASSAKPPFDEEIIEFLNNVSRILMKDTRSKLYSDVITLAFWLRKASVQSLKERYDDRRDKVILQGRGVVFHIAPSNVPVNFAYSLFVGMLTGNINIVRVPSKDFEQIRIITDAINNALNSDENLRNYVALVRYERDKLINDAFSSICDARIIWGGDATIDEIRKSSLPPRSIEIAFADRFSLAVIDSDLYIKSSDKIAVARDFYNDTYFSDQNACTSPRIVIWIGGKKDEAKELFWDELYKIVKEKYVLQPIQSVNKLTSSYLSAVYLPGVKIIRKYDNLLFRINVISITNNIMEMKDNSGFFFEYDCDDVMDLKTLCDDKRCQTIGLYGDTQLLMPLLKSGIKGVDRVIPIGKTMDFDMIWDGYNLVSQLTRIIVL